MGMSKRRSRRQSAHLAPCPRRCCRFEAPIAQDLPPDRRVRARAKLIELVHFTFGQLFASLAVSSIGFVLVTYGRRMARLPQVVAGLVLMVYPYFVPGVVATLVVAAALLAALWLAVRFGW
jgi:hypothetical protein